MERSEDLLRLKLPCDVHAAHEVRKRLRDVQDDNGWSLQDACLVATELVANAVRHSGCTDEHVLEVRIARNKRRLLISVRDPGISGAVAEPRDRSNEEHRHRPGGLGLNIVQRLSVRWGAERRDGYRVWAELPASHSAQRRPAR